MKLSMKILAIAAMFFTFTFAANAQRGDHPKDPTKKAEKQTARMVEKLNLNDAQTAQVETINLNYAKKMQEARENNKENREAMKAVRTTIDSEKTAEMQQVLTAAQFETYVEMQAKKGKGKKGKKGKKNQVEKA